jgi:hypothetical protein
MKTIGLCMIVKDEAHVILRCLASVRPTCHARVLEALLRCKIATRS